MSGTAADSPVQGRNQMHPRADTFPNDRSFELGEHAHHLKHGFAAGRRSVDNAFAVCGNDGVRARLAVHLEPVRKNPSRISAMTPSLAWQAFSPGRAAATPSIV